MKLWSGIKDPIFECRCDDRLKTKSEESTCLGYTGLLRLTRKVVSSVRVRSTLKNDTDHRFLGIFVYYESTKRALKIRPIYECRCDERDNVVCLL
jgi:hypothetical protein